jgi:hypothetical protein
MIFRRKFPIRSKIVIDDQMIEQAKYFDVQDVM